MGSFFRLSFKFETLLALLGFLTLTLIYFWEILIPEIVFSVSDHITFFIPQRQRWVEQVLEGTFPLWNPNLMGGVPLFATLQTAVLYPFSIFYLWFPFFQVFKFTIFAHYALAGFGMYALMRGDGTSRMGSLLSALCLMFGGYLVSLHYYLSTLFPVAWVPLLLLFFFWGLKRQDFRGAVFAGTITAFMFFSGGVETCMQVLPWLLIAGLFPQFIFKNEIVPDRPFQVKYLLACFFIFAGLCAIQLFPTYELSQLSSRGLGFSFEKSTQWSLALSDLKQLVTADPYSYYQALDNKVESQVWLRSLYVGALPIILAGFFVGHGGRRVIFCGVVILFSLLMALGKNSLLYQAMYDLIPWVQSIRYPVKFILPVMILLPMAAGWGLDIFRSQMNPQYPSGSRKALFLLALSATCMVLYASLEWQSGFWMNAFSDHTGASGLEIIHNYRRLAMFTALIGFCLFVAFKTVKARPVFLSLALFLYGVDIFFSGIMLFRVIPVETFNTLSETSRFIQSDPDKGKIFISTETESAPQGRVWKNVLRGVGVANRHMSQEVRTLPEVRQVNSWTVFLPFHGKMFQSLLAVKPLEERINLLAMLDVKHVLTSEKISHPDFKKVFPPAGEKQPTGNISGPPPVQIYENPFRLGRAFLVGACFQANNESELKQALLSQHFHPQTLVVLETSPPEFPCQNPAVPKGISNGKVTVLNEGYDSLSLEAATAEKSFLFIGDSFYPGWEARVDGQPVPIYRANYAFRALVLEPGTHRVEMVYRPLSFQVGAGISALTLMLCSVVLIRHPRAKVIYESPQEKPVPEPVIEKVKTHRNLIGDQQLGWSLYLFVIFLTMMGASDIYYSMEAGERFLLCAFFSVIFLQVMLVKTRWKEANDIRLSGLVIAWALFLLWSAFGFFYSIRPEDGLYYVFNFLGALSLLLGLVLYLKSEKQVIDLLRVLLICAGTHALLSMYGQAMFPRDVTGWKSLFINANFLASYLLFPIAMSLYFFIFGGDTRDRYLGGVIFFLTALTLGFTQSRSGLLAGTIEVFLLFGFLTWQKNWHAFKRCSCLIVATGATYMILLFGLYSLWEQAGILETGDSLSLVAHGTDVSRSASARMVFWQASWNIFNDFGFLGAGPRSFPLLFPYYGELINQARFPIHSHSTYINIATDHGAIGLFLFLTGIFLILKKLVSIFKSGSMNPALGFFLVAGVLGFFIHGLVEFCLPNPVFFYGLIIAIAMIESLNIPDALVNRKTFFQSRGAFLTVSVIFLMMTFSWLGSLYFYSRIMNQNIPKATDVQQGFDQSQLALKFCPQCDRPHLYRAWAHMLEFDQSRNPDSLLKANIEMERASRLAYINPEHDLLKGRWWLMQKRYDRARLEYLNVYRFSRRYKEAREELVILNRLMKQKPVI